MNIRWLVPASFIKIYAVVHEKWNKQTELTPNTTWLKSNKDLPQVSCAQIMIWASISATDTTNSKQIFLKLTKISIFLYFLRSVVCGNHVESGWHQTFISCRCIFRDYFLQTSIKYMQQFMRNFVNRQTEFIPNTT